MKKMSDVFELPLAVFDDGHTIVDSNGFHAAQCDLESEAESIIMAINMHDELVEMLVQSRKELEDWMYSTSLYDSDDTVSKINELLERCK